MKQSIILGNIITMDEKRPFAKAALVKNGVFAFIGSAEEVKQIASRGARVLDYGDNFIYPGFIESHSHGYFAGDRLIGQANLAQVGVETNYPKYREIIKEFIAKNPQKQVYIAAGWVENEEYVTKAYLDEIYSEKPGNPDGYICENPLLDVIAKLPTSVEEAKNYLLAWQDFAFQKGYTAVADAGVELFCKHAPQAYHELEEEGRLKLRTYGYMLAPDNVADPKAEVARVAADRVKYGERFNDHDKMVEMIAEADKEGMAVHVHSEGGGATHFMLGCIEDAEKITGDKDQRNVLAHLHFVTDEDIRRMAATGSVPAVAPLWSPKTPGMTDQEVIYVGQELSDQSYPIKSFYEAGANVVFHSDYPVSPMMDIKLSIYTAEKRNYPKDVLGGVASPRNMEEAITREQSLRAMTINVARQFHQEHRMGSIEFGKIANMTVFDCDFLHDDIEKVGNANIIATIVDGEEVYKA